MTFLHRKKDQLALACSVFTVYFAGNWQRDPVFSCAAFSPLPLVALKRIIHFEFLNSSVAKTTLLLNPRRQ